MFMRRDDDDINAAVEPPAVFSGVVGDGVVLGIAGGGEALRLDVFADEQDSDDLTGARGGELPVGLELRRVDGNVVGMALDAEIAGHGDKDGAEAVKGVHGAGAEIGRAAFKESDLAQTEDEAFRNFAHGDGASLDLFG